MVANRSLECPQCGTAFEQRVEHGVTIDYCDDCGGVWLDPGELGALTGSTHGKHGHSHSHRDVDIDIDDEEAEYEEAEYEEAEYEEAEEESDGDGGLLGAVTAALGGGDEAEEEEAWGEEDAFGGEEEAFGEEEEF